jgi:hypothetical protein
MGGSATSKGRACEARWGDVERCVARVALGVIDRGPAASGVDRSTSYDTPRLKLPAIGIITYVKRV